MKLTFISILLLVSTALAYDPAKLIYVRATATKHSVTLSWKAPTGVNATNYLYFVYRATCPTCTFMQLNKNAVKGTTYKDLTVATGATYYYEVRSVLQSIPSNVVMAKIPST